MKKRVLALLLACLTLVGLLAGCNQKTSNPSNGDENDADTPKYGYQTTFTPLEIDDSLKVEYIYGMCFSGDKVYFVGNAAVGETTATDPETGEPYLDEAGQPITYSTYEPRLFQLEMDTMKVSPMEAYKPSAIPEGMEGSVSINSIIPSSDGSIWVNEQLYAYSASSGGAIAYDSVAVAEATTTEAVAVDTPVAEEPTTDTEYQEINRSTLIHIGADGTVLSSLEIKAEDGTYLGSILADDAGYLYSTDWSNVLIFDGEGKQVATIPVENGINNLVKLNDGKVYANMWFNSEDGSYNGLALVDATAKALSEDVIPLPNGAYNTYPGNDEYPFFYDNNGTIYGYNAQTKEGERMFAWLDCDINSDQVSQFTIKPDGTIVALESTYDEQAMEQKYNLVTIKRVDASTLPPKEEITLAWLYTDWDLRNQIVKFNRSQDKVRINVVDYSQYNTNDNYDAGIQQLNTEILSGKVPDILCTNGLPIEQYEGKGVLLDLWPLIDNDSELSREDLMTHLFDVMSVDGKLYQVVSSFSIDTVAGNTDIVGDRDTWTLQDLQQAKEQMSDDATIFGESDVKTDILYTCVSHGVDGFIDWANKTCSFDSQEFIDMLNFANSFPKEFDWENYDYSSADSEYSRLRSGKQMLTRAYLYSFSDVQYQKLLHGGNVSFVGYPTTSGNGSSFNISGGMAISASCKNPEAAWSFVRTILTEDYQTTNYMWQFPTNKHSFEAYKEQAMKQEYYEDPETGEQVPQPTMTYEFDGQQIDILALTQEEYDLFMRVYENCNSVTAYNQEINNIITEETAAFFDGQKTAEETAKIIQDRVSLYVAEKG